MKRRLLYLINPISGIKAKKRSLLKDTITKRTNQKNIPFEIEDTRADGNYNYLLKKVKEEEITDVIICGGDGTVNKIAAALINVNVNLGIIPSGSGNGLAYTLKLPDNVEDALKIIFARKTKLIDAFYINENFSCMLCGIGMDAKIAHDFAKQKTRGLSTYVKESLKNFFNSTHYNFTLKINDQKINTDAFFISIANSNQFGNNFTIAPKASLHDGMLDIVIVKKMNKAKLLWAMGMHLKFGKVMSADAIQEFNNDILYFQADQLKITNHHNAPLHIDGDPSETAKEFKIKIIPKALRMLHP